MSRSLGTPLRLVLAAALSLAACKAPPPPPAPGTGPATGPGSEGRPPASIAREVEREKEALQAAVEAYVFGYPLVSAELARRVETNVDKPGGAQAPMGQLARGAAAGCPGAPDLLEADAWLDADAGPWVLSLPEARGRFHAVSIRSAWNQRLLLEAGKGAKGKGGRLAVTGRGWTGKLPAGTREVKSPTALVRLEVRVLAAGGAGDRAEAQAWLDRVTLLPLGANPKKYSPPPGRPDASLDVRRPIRDQVHGLDAVIYFKLLATLLRANPPAPGDRALLPTLALIGLVPGKDFDPTGLDASIIKALVGVPGAAQEKILAAAQPAAPLNGWIMAGPAAVTPGPLGRAAAVAAGVDRELDGLALVAEVDGGGKPLEGAGPRALRFTRGKGPPAEVLWTLSACDQPASATGGRGPLTSRGKFQYGRDGSLELLLRPAPPRGREANWLQVPAGRYTLVLRLHGPRPKAPSALDGSWKPPAVARAK